MKRKAHTLFKYLVRYPIEAVLTYLIYLITAILPIEKSSAFAGLLGRVLGKYFKSTATAKKNLSWALPHKTKAEIDRITDEVWENVGRVIGEYSGLSKIDIYNDDRFEIVGTEYVDQLRDDGQPGIIFSGHLASWEVAIMAATQRGLRLSQLYRTMNNPLVDPVAIGIQRQIGQEVLTKGTKDARRVLDVLKRGDHLFLLLDQKFNRGISVPFFGREAMTAPAAARMALRYKCPLLPVRVERLGGFRFRITFYPPIKLPKVEDINKATYKIMCTVNHLLEEWIRARPEQWMWLHNRWPKVEAKK